MKANIGWNHPRMSYADFVAKGERMRAEQLARDKRELEDSEARTAKWARWCDRRDAELRASGMLKSLAHVTRSMTRHGGIQSRVRSDISIN